MTVLEKLIQFKAALRTAACAPLEPHNPQKLIADHNVGFLISVRKSNVRFTRARASALGTYG
jgi:hypothetical protein